MKNSNETIGNRTHDLLACSVVPEPTVPPCFPYRHTHAAIKSISDSKQTAQQQVYMSHSGRAMPIPIKRKSFFYIHIVHPDIMKVLFIHKLMC